MIKKNYLPKLIAFAIVLFIALGVVSLMATKASANPSQFFANTTSSCRTMAVSATTTRTWQTAGTATSTICLDAASLSGGSRALEGATLLIYRLASSPASATKVSLEYSNECYVSAPNTDWYPGKFYSIDATTSASVGFTGGDSLTVNFATTTVGGSANGDFDTIAIKVPTPVNCVRAVITTPIGAASSSVWGELVGRVQNF